MEHGMLHLIRVAGAWGAGPHPDPDLAWHEPAGLQLHWVRDNRSAPRPALALSLEHRLLRGSSPGNESGTDKKEYLTRPVQVPAGQLADVRRIGMRGLWASCAASWSKG